MLRWHQDLPSFVILPTYLTFLRYRVYSERTAGLDRAPRGRWKLLRCGFDPIWQTEKKTHRRDEGICRFGSCRPHAEPPKEKRCR